MGFVIFLFVMGGIASTIAYMLPSIIAFRNGHEHRWLILFANVFSGWTGVAWFPLLLWACRVFGGPGLAQPEFQAAAMRRRQPAFPAPVDPPATAQRLPASVTPIRPASGTLSIRPRANW